MHLRVWKLPCLVLMSTALLFVPTGCKKAAPIKLACNASAPAIYPGDPLTVTATPSSVSTKKHVDVLYSWSGDGVTGNGTTATVSTGSLQPGNYTLTGKVKEGKTGKEGEKPGETAECQASFLVKAFEPPTISCSANPGTIKPGDTSTITATAVSPQRRPLTYSYYASAGSISGTGTAATFSSAGVPTGSVNVTCKVSDDKNHTANADASLTIVAPPLPPFPHAQTLCTTFFTRDKTRPTRVDNEAKACLDQVALDLEQQANAKVVIVGEATSAENAPRKHHAKHAKPEKFAAQRAVNSKDYLVKDKGIDSTRISVATNSVDGQEVLNYLIPAGANFTADVQGTTPVDEMAIKPQPRKPIARKHHHTRSRRGR